MPFATHTPLFLGQSRVAGQQIQTSSHHLIGGFISKNHPFFAQITDWLLTWDFCAAL
jgi:hypothetical protein